MREEEGTKWFNTLTAPRKKSAEGKQTASDISVQQGKMPPHSLEAEMAVLGSMMLDTAAVAKAIEIIQSDYFYRDSHKRIYEAMLGLFERRVEIDLLTLSEELRRRGLLEQVGGSFYLTELNMSSPTASNIEHHCRIVQERWLKRSLISTAGEILSRCYDDTTDALEEIDKAEAQIFDIAEKRLRRGFLTMNDLAHKTFAFISEMLNKGEHSGITGIPTGFTKLDEMLSGLQKSDFIVLAARPSMGKTALALSLCRNAAIVYEQPVAIFSLEMAATQLMQRLLAAESQINLSRFRGGKLSQDMMPKILDAINRLAESPIFIDDSPSLSIMEMRAKCRRLKAEHNIQLVVVDYLQLMSSPKAESREREISIISRSLKQIAKELDIPIIALAQLNRGVEARADKTPMLSDLRESGSIEQDADVVMFVNRREYYGITTYDDGAPTEGTAEIIIGKQRNGSTGEVRLAFLKELARFENLSLRHDLPPAYGNTSYDDVAS